MAEEDDGDDHMRPSQERTPRPDPTSLTTAQLFREVSALKEIIDSRIESLMSRYNERFSSINMRFSERDIRLEQATRDASVAIGAALNAAKEAAAKSDASTIKQIDQQATMIDSTTRALDSKITDLKDRMFRYESTEASLVGSRQGVQAGIGVLLGLMGVLMAIISMAVALYHKV